MSNVRFSKKNRINIRIQRNDKMSFHAVYILLTENNKNNGTFYILWLA